jgi:hypothetical protein
MVLEKIDFPGALSTQCENLKMNVIKRSRGPWNAIDASREQTEAKLIKRKLMCATRGEVSLWCKLLYSTVQQNRDGPESFRFSPADYVTLIC